MDAVLADRLTEIAKEARLIGFLETARVIEAVIAREKCVDCSAEPTER